MTLELNNDELRTLLNMVSLALYVTENNQEERCQAEIERMDALADRLYETGCKEGNRDIAEYDPSQRQYMLKDSYVTDSFYALAVREFEDDFFWAELASALAERDLRVKGAAASMTDPEAFSERLQDQEDYYMDIFTEHGVDRLHVIPSEPHQ